MHALTHSLTHFYGIFKWNGDQQFKQQQQFMQHVTHSLNSEWMKPCKYIRAMICFVLVLVILCSGTRPDVGEGGGVYAFIRLHFHRNVLFDIHRIHIKWINFFILHFEVFSALFAFAFSPLHYIFSIRFSAVVVELNECFVFLALCSKHNNNIYSKEKINVCHSKPIKFKQIRCILLKMNIGIHILIFHEFPNVKNGNSSFT